MRIWALLVVAALSTAAVLASSLLPSHTPAPAAASGAADVAAGGIHSCAVTTAGAVKCWGRNEFGQIGDGTIIDRQVAQDVLTLDSGVADVEAGFGHSCALTTGGGVKCWGRNVEGQIGDATNTQRTTPENVSGLTSGVAAIATGHNHTCALTTGGGVKCWGDNSFGQIGDGTQDDSNTPVDVSGLTSDVGAIGAGDFHTCAVTTGGALKCWGLNEYGQIGNGASGGFVTEPTTVNSMSEFVASVDGGLGHTCALRTDGGVRCWGLNIAGQLGNASSANNPSPVSVSGLSTGAAQVDVGQNHSCARMDSGAVKCWGSNDAGQIGDATTDNQLTPVEVSGLSSGVSDVAAGGSHSCAVAPVGVVCWGANTSGQIGDGTKDMRTTPVQVDGLDAASKETGTPTNTPTPTPTPTPTGGCPDYDGDTACDDVDPDDDNDGCEDTTEQQTAPGSESSGGRRDYHWFWDFYDVPTGAAYTRDHAISGNDIFAVIGRFNSTDAGPGDFDRNSDPFSTPNPLVLGHDRANYHPAYDRGGIIGPDPWDLGAANGALASTDIFAVLGQFNHVCA